MKKNKLLKFIGNILFYVVLILLLSVSFLMIKVTKEGKQPTIMGQKFFSVLSGSMEPTIMVGDLVIAKEVPKESLQVGDIITFRGENSDSIVTHRIKEVINEDGKISYITQGDANNVQDQNPVESELVIGKVEKWIPKVGSVASWMKSNLKTIIVLILVATFLVIMWSKVISKLKAEDEKEKIDKNKELDL